MYPKIGYLSYIFIYSWGGVRKKKEEPIRNKETRKAAGDPKFQRLRKLPFVNNNNNNNPKTETKQRGEKADDGVISIPIHSAGENAADTCHALIRSHLYLLLRLPHRNRRMLQQLSG